MKNTTQNIQILIPGNTLSRMWRKVATVLNVGIVSALLIVTLIQIQPDTTVATGGCSAPGGVCTTIIDW